MDGLDADGDVAGEHRDVVQVRARRHERGELEVQVAEDEQAHGRGHAKPRSSGEQGRGQVRQCSGATQKAW